MSRRGPIPIVRISALPDCAYCRGSELRPILKAYRCKQGLPMNAKSCSQFRDSRKQTSQPPDFMR
jgi:hypothetical protein